MPLTSLKQYEELLHISHCMPGSTAYAAGEAHSSNMATAMTPNSIVHITLKYGKRQYLV